MGLIKMTFEEKRKRFIKGVLENLKGFTTEYGNFGSVANYIYKSFGINYFYSNDFDECVEQFYGSTDDKEDIEWKLACILFSYSILKKHLKIEPYRQSGSYDQNMAQMDLAKWELLTNNTKVNLIKNFPDYGINWDGEDNFVDFVPKETRTITENLNDIDAEKAAPIKSLLHNMKTDTELRGHINEVYLDFEKIEINQYKDKVNSNDFGILKDSYKLAKRIVNDANDGAKGHEGKSQLTTRDVAHNFALLCSLVYKIIAKSKDKISS